LRIGDLAAKHERLEGRHVHDLPSTGDVFGATLISVALETSSNGKILRGDTSK
jgi:hypothetical protein